MNHNKNQQDRQDKNQQDRQDKNQQDRQDKNQQDQQDKNQQDQQDKNQQDQQDKNQQDQQDKNQQDQQDKNQQDQQDKNQQDQQDKNQQDQRYKNITQELIEEKNRFIRLFAEFENYKKRIQKERLDLFKTANKDLIISLLPVLDDFERGLVEISQSEGMTLIREKFIKILKEKGLKKANIEQGDTFNTDLHEAITQIETSQSNLKGKIVKIVESGYILGDKVIRHAKVIIGK